MFGGVLAQWKGRESDVTEKKNNRWLATCMLNLHRDKKRTKEPGTGGEILSNPTGRMVTLQYLELEIHQKQIKALVRRNKTEERISKDLDRKIISFFFLEGGDVVFYWFTQSAYIYRYYIIYVTHIIGKSKCIQIFRASSPSWEMIFLT